MSTTRLTIFGATDKTGVPLVQQALDHGYIVTAVARTPGTRFLSHPRLTVVQGDVTDLTAIGQAEAVISVIGHVKGSPAYLQDKTTRHISSGRAQSRPV